MQNHPSFDDFSCHIHLDYVDALTTEKSWGHKSQMYITLKNTKVYLQNKYVCVCGVLLCKTHKKSKIW